MPNMKSNLCAKRFPHDDVDWRPYLKNNLHSRILHLLSVVSQQVFPEHQPRGPCLASASCPHVFMIFQRRAQLAVEINVRISCTLQVGQGRQVFTDDEWIERRGGWPAHLAAILLDSFSLFVLGGRVRLSA